MNEKKLWASRYLGELVSNYNINGNVHLCISKTIDNSLNGLTYQNWVMDVHTQISSIQQTYRQGANIPTLILLGTILRQQIMASYQVRGNQKEYMDILPIELGGYPTNPVFELAVNGVNCHYHKLLGYVKQNISSKISTIILRCLRLSIMRLKSLEEDEHVVDIKRAAKTQFLKNHLTPDETDEGSLRLDYANIRLPYRGDVFSCIHHLMPQSVKKCKKTVKRIKSLPFVSDGLEMVVTRARDLSM